MFKKTFAKKINYSSLDLKNELKKINLFKALFILFLLGMVYGAMLVGLKQLDAVNKLGLFMFNLNDAALNRSIAMVFMSSINGALIIAAILFVAGFFPIGQVIAFLIPVFCGLGIGFSTAYSCAVKGFLGFLKCLILIAPSATISTVAILLGAKESIKFANKNFKVLFPDNFEQDMHGALKQYVFKFLIVIVFSLIAAVLDCIFLCFVAKIIKF